MQKLIEPLAEQAPGGVSPEGGSGGREHIWAWASIRGPARMSMAIRARPRESSLETPKTWHKDDMTRGVFLRFPELKRLGLPGRRRDAEPLGRCGMNGVAVPVSRTLGGGLAPLAADITRVVLRQRVEAHSREATAGPKLLAVISQLTCGALGLKGPVLGQNLVLHLWRLRSVSRGAGTARPHERKNSQNELLHR